MLRFFGKKLGIVIARNKDDSKVVASDENGIIGRNLMHSGPRKSPFLTFSPHTQSLSVYYTSKFLSHLLILFAISYFSFYRRQFSSDSVLALWSLPWGKSFETIFSLSL